MRKGTMLTLTVGQAAVVLGLLAATGGLLFVKPRPASDTVPAPAAVVAKAPPAPEEPRPETTNDLPMPAVVAVSTPVMKWHDGMDPLLVQNIDVTDPLRYKFIEQVKGLFTFIKIVDDTDAEGNKILAIRLKGDKRLYHEGDRLPNTRFTILNIFRSRVIHEPNGDVVHSGLDLVSDTGARFTLYLDTFR